MARAAPRGTSEECSRRVCFVGSAAAESWLGGLPVLTIRQAACASVFVMWLESENRRRRPPRRRWWDALRALSGPSRGPLGGGAPVHGLLFPICDYINVLWLECQHVPAAAVFFIFMRNQCFTRGGCSLKVIIFGVGEKFAKKYQSETI